MLSQRGALQQCIQLWLLKQHCININHRHRIKRHFFSKERNNTSTGKHSTMKTVKLRNIKQGRFHLNGLIRIVLRIEVGPTNKQLCNVVISSKYKHKGTFKHSVYVTYKLDIGTQCCGTSSCTVFFSVITGVGDKCVLTMRTNLSKSISNCIPPSVSAC